MYIYLYVCTCYKVKYTFQVDMYTVYLVQFLRVLCFIGLYLEIQRCFNRRKLYVNCTCNLTLTAFTSCKLVKLKLSQAMAGITGVLPPALYQVTTPKVSYNLILKFTFTLLKKKIEDDSSWQQLPAVTSVTSSYVQLPLATFSYHQLPSVTSSYLKLPAVTFSYQQLPSVTSSYQKLPFSYHQLPSVTSSYQQLPQLSEITLQLPAYTSATSSYLQLHSFTGNYLSFTISPLNITLCL